jgi:hypothetical protein
LKNRLISHHRNPFGDMFGQRTSQSESDEYVGARCVEMRQITPINVLGGFVDLHEFSIFLLMYYAS